MHSKLSTNVFMHARMQPSSFAFKSRPLKRLVQVLPIMPHFWAAQNAVRLSQGLPACPAIGCLPSSPLATAATCAASSADTSRGVSSGVRAGEAPTLQAPRPLPLLRRERPPPLRPRCSRLDMLLTLRMTSSALEGWWLMDAWLKPVLPRMNWEAVGREQGGCREVRKGTCGQSTQRGGWQEGRCATATGMLRQQQGQP